MMLLIISVLFNWSYFKEKQEQRLQYQIFLNHYYFEVNKSLSIVNKLLESDQSSKDEVNIDLILLSEHLNRFAYVSSSVADYVRAYPSGINLFEMVANDILLGSEYNGEQIPPFIVDNQLTKNEKAYLAEIKKHLEYIHGQLYSEETGQENLHLSKDQFKNIAGYVTSLGSEHNGLLVIYLDN